MVPPQRGHECRRPAGRNAAALFMSQDGLHGLRLGWSRRAAGLVAAYEPTAVVMAPGALALFSLAFRHEAVLRCALERLAIRSDGLGRAGFTLAFRKKSAISAAQSYHFTAGPPPQFSRVEPRRPEFGWLEPRPPSARSALPLRGRRSPRPIHRLSVAAAVLPDGAAPIPTQVH